MNAPPCIHPSEQTLSSYGLGKLDDSSAEAVNEHLEQCPDCRKRVAEMSADSFLERVRDAQARPESPAPIVSPLAGLSMPAGGPTSPAPPPTSTLPPGLADHPDYEIVRELGRGGMGVVYLAQNKLMGRLEVLKVVGGQLVERPGVRDRFLREVQSAAKLQHKNIVTAYSAIRLGESIVLAMEYVEGDDLAKVVKSGGPLPVVHACYFIHQAALGLQHAHERGMVHRDIKPANLILAREGKKAVVKVLDFGLAKLTSEGQVDGGLTREGQMLGTPEYIAPEQIRNAQSADIRADIYSLGCTFYYLLTGGPPFRGDSLWDLYQAHFSMDAGPLNLVRPEIPVELAALVAKMLAKEPGRRFQTPGEVAQALVPFFKPGANPGSRPGPEISRVGQAASSPQPVGGGSAPAQPATLGAAPAPAPRVLPKPSPEGVAWESLIEFKETERSVAAVKPKPEVAPTSAPVRRPPWVWASVATAVLLFGLVVAWLAGVFRVKTPEGYLVISDLPANSVVTVDGKVYTVEWPGGKGPAKVTVPAGGHRVKVELNGVEVHGEQVQIAAGEEKWIDVRLERKDNVAAHKFVPLFNGKDKTGWVESPSNKGEWKVVDGVLQAPGSGPEGARSAILNTRRQNFMNFRLHLKFRYQREGRGQIEIRHAHISDSRNGYMVCQSSWPTTDQWQVPTGSITKMRNHRYGSGIAWQKLAVAFPVPISTWNTIDITAVKARIITSVNGKEVADYTDASGWFGSGGISLEAWYGTVEFQEITIEELPDNVDASEFARLFNGKDLSGWTFPTGSETDWTVENGSIRGSATDHGSRIATSRANYEDFHLRMEVRTTDNLPVILIRASHSDGDVKFYVFRTGALTPGGIAYLGKYRIKWVGHAGDRSPPTTDGLREITAPKVPGLAKDTWQRVEIIAVGNEFRMLVDDREVSAFQDTESRLKRGQVAFQLPKGCHVEIRNIEIKELNGKGAAGNEVRQRRFVPLFNGKDKTGWVESPSNHGEWRVVGGVLQARGSGQPGAARYAILNTQRQNFMNFRLHLKFRYLQEGTEDQGRGQIEIRHAHVSDSRNAYVVCQTTWPTRDRWQIPAGSIAKMRNHPYGTGWAWEKQAVAFPVPINTWNTIDITAVKARIVTWVNGKEVADYTDASGWFGSGGISLAAWYDTVVEFQEITIEELPE